MHQEQQDLLKWLKYFQRKLEADHIQPLTIEEKDQFRKIVSNFGMLCENQNKEIKKARNVSQYFEFVKRDITKACEVLTKPASNMKLMQVARPARECLNLLRHYIK